MNNKTLATMYGRTTNGDLRPVAVSEAGAVIVGIGGPGTIQEEVATFRSWSTVTIGVLTPLLSWTAFSAASRGVIFAFVNLDDSPGDALFIIETSEDGLFADKALRYEYQLAPGEAGSYETPLPNMRNYYRLSVQPVNIGETPRVKSLVRHVPRAQPVETNDVIVYSFRSELVGAIDGVNATFRLEYAPLPPDSLEVFKNGQRMTPGIDYTLVDREFTFVSGSIPLTGEVLDGSYHHA